MKHHFSASTHHFHLTDQIEPLLFIKSTFSISTYVSDFDILFILLLQLPVNAVILLLICWNVNTRQTVFPVELCAKPGAGLLVQGNPKRIFFSSENHWKSLITVKLGGKKLECFFCQWQCRKTPKCVDFRFYQWRHTLISPSSQWLLYVEKRCTSSSDSVNDYTVMSNSGGSQDVETDQWDFDGMVGDKMSDGNAFREL